MLSQLTKTSLDAELEEKCRSAKVPGMALVVAQNGKPVYEKYYGFRDAENGLPVTQETIFGVASITKSLTALAVIQLEGAGKLAAGDPVVQWLPELDLPVNITIHHLLSHSSGLPGMEAVNRARADSIQRDPDGEYLSDNLPVSGDYPPVKTVPELMETMNSIDYTLLGPPGAVFNYSNEGYALLQEIIERASGKPYISYMEEHILYPLDMHRSFFRTADLEDKENVAELYAYKKEGEWEVFHSPFWWDVGEIYSNGSLKTCTADLMKYLELYRLKGMAGSRRIVSEAGIRKMASVQATMPTGEHYGYGLQLGRHHGIPLFGHGGSIKGVSSHMKVMEKEELTVSVLVNLAEVAAEDLALTALDHILGIQSAKTDRPEVCKVEQGQMEKFAGVYESAEGQKAEIVIDDGQLQLKTHNSGMLLTPYAEDGFCTPAGDKLRFLAGDSGEITGLFKGVRVIPKLDHAASR